jgi:hypothetical protein
MERQLTTHVPPFTDRRLTPRSPLATVEDQVSGLLTTTAAFRHVATMQTVPAFS